MRLRLFSFALIAACSSDEHTATGPVELIVAASDYSSSQICAAPGGCRHGVDLGKDPMLATSGDRVFFVARDNDFIIEVDPASGVPFAKTKLLVDERHSNPHDVAAAKDGTLFVPLYNVPKIAFIKDGVVDPDMLDLASFDADGNPEADAIRIVEVGGVEKAFVTLERLTWVPEGKLLSKQTSQMLRIDVATRTIEAAIDLVGKNPFNPMSLADGALFMAEPGDFDATKEDGAGIERFDTATSTSRLVVSEKDLDGSVAEVSVDGECGAAIVAGPQTGVNPTSVITFHARDGQPSPPVLGPTAGYDLQGLAWRGRFLYVGDRRALTVHVFERDEGSCTVRDTGRTISLRNVRPVALRPAK